MSKKPGRTSMQIKLKRVYNKAEESDGVRILVERLWPRGLSKKDAQVDLWLKDVAPSGELRKWFGHDPSKWDEFRKLYFAELESKSEALGELTNVLRKGDVTFVYASKEENYNNSVALKEYLEKRYNN
ncbi:MAG: DUF488 domain-containing protein [Deltaproteobacteria bacterium]